MKLLLSVLFALLAVSTVVGFEAAAFWDGTKYVELKVYNDEIDISKAVPVMDLPGFWEGRIKPDWYESSNRRGRIVGGAIVTPHAHPYQAGLFMSFATGTGLCGASVLSTRTILTAAHCLDDTTSTQVIMGAHQITTVEPNQQRQTVFASGYSLHAGYDRSTLENDVALLTLPTPATLNAFVQPSVLPTAFRDQLFAGELATVTGWGRTSDTVPGSSAMLRSTQNNVVTNAVCRAAFGDSIVDSFLCISTVGGRSACSGDSGGPLTVQIAGQTVQIGIAVFVSSAGCEAGFPGGFARVTSFLDWIAANRID